MVRLKEYDRNEVLERAIDQFWQKGYKATSMTDLVHATGLNTASMYKEFGDKDGLFEESLDYYRQNIRGPRFDILIEEPNYNGVEAFLENVVTGATSKEYKGCLMMNHLAQKHSISARAAKKIDEYCTNAEDLLAAALKNAQTAGDIPAHKDPKSLASFVMCSLHGMVLYSRLPNTKKNLLQILDNVLRALQA
ncbi:MAG: TetR/AcrR family transcriptional regulator [Rhodospirillaceae bacterium]|jgi:AcrR family transcriptional regulator|nr:TetR/AcrR family transcriptional regulator [Rhodospirillaceae bacterium]MBT5938798.1 TetR/AcrR family transcriptional regulator [Rhodospirillaceae bacterium]MBT7266466.1 TetR/AcrR family transcriptional regulator [Rhodospirillaceae bacterium]